MNSHNHIIFDKYQILCEHALNITVMGKVVYNKCMQNRSSNCANITIQVKNASY